MNETKLDGFNENIKIEAPDVEGMIWDLGKASQQIMNNLGKALVFGNSDFLITEDKYPLRLEVAGSCFGFKSIYSLNINKDYVDNLKSNIKPEPKLNKDSLLNDIQIGVTMLRSEFTSHKLTDQMVACIGWQYHILEKHFGLEMPEDFKKEVKGDSELEI